MPNDNLKPETVHQNPEAPSGDWDLRLVLLLRLLAERLVWIAPVGNDDSYRKCDENGVWHPISALRGFMVCKRSVNNADGKSTRVDFLRVDKSLPWRWKKPFRECECMFETMEAAITAAAAVEGISLQNDKLTHGGPTQ